MRLATLVAERFFVRKQIEFCASAISTVVTGRDPPPWTGTVSTSWESRFPDPSSMFSSRETARGARIASIGVEVPVRFLGDQYVI
jgi:hypothetical protein